MDEDSEVLYAFFISRAIRDIVQIEAIAKPVELMGELRYGTLRQVPESVLGCETTSQYVTSTKFARTPHLWLAVVCPFQSLS
jgi:hypothetical protein